MSQLTQPGLPRRLRLRLTELNFEPPVEVVRKYFFLTLYLAQGLKLLYRKV